MTRWLLYRFFPYFSILFALIGAVWLLLSETGLQLIWKQVEKRLPDSIHVEQLSGSLLQGVQIRQLRIDDDSMVLRLNNAWLYWKPASLLQGRLHIAEILLADGYLQLRDSTQTNEQATPPQPRPAQLPSLPNIRIDQIDLRKLRLRKGETEYALERVRGHAELAAGRLELQLDQIQSQGQRWRLQQSSSVGKDVLRLETLSLQKTGDKAQINAQGYCLWPSMNCQFDLSWQSLGYADFHSAEGELQTSVNWPEGGKLNYQAQLGAEADYAQLSPWIIQAQADNNEKQKFELSLRQGLNSVLLNGELAETLNAQAQIQILQIADSHPDWQGRLQGDVRIAQANNQITANWSLQGQDIQWPSGQIADLSSQGTLAPGRAQELAVNLNIDQSQVSALKLDKLSLQTTGLLNNWQTEFETFAQINGVPIQMQHALQGKWVQQELSWVWQSAQGRVDDSLWVLDTEKPTRFSWSSKAWELAQLCFNQKSHPGYSCLSAEQSGDKLGAQWDINKLQLKHFAQAWLKDVAPQSQLLGAVDLQLQIPTAPIEQLQAKISLKNQPIRLQLNSDKTDSVDVLSLESGGVDAEYQNGELKAQWWFPTAQDRGLHGQVHLRDQQIIQAKAGLALSHFDFIPVLSPEILDFQAKLHGEFQAKGPLDSPQVAGQLTLQQGHISLAEPNIDLEDLNLNLKANGPKSLSLHAKTRSGEGQLMVNGQFHWANADHQLQAEIQGKDFLAVNNENAKLSISPKLKLALLKDQLTLSGLIHIPQAEIHPQDIQVSSGAIRPDADEIIVGEEKEKPAYKLNSRLTLSLGKSVNFKGFGLTSRIAGKLALAHESEQLPTAVGELSLRDGHYKAYGQDLNIERGRLIFSGGPVSEPGLDVQAYRQARSDVRVGLKVRGPLRRPEFSLYSEPSMRETDQLSYLVLGRPAESDSEGDNAALNNAALALGLKGGDFLAKQVKGRLGLDEVSIGTRPGESTDQAALVLGKYLSPDLYVSYGLGLFDPVSVFRLRYQLSSKWTLETETGVESGGDIFYTIER